MEVIMLEADVGVHLWNGRKWVQAKEESELGYSPNTRLT